MTAREEMEAQVFLDGKPVTLNTVVELGEQNSTNVMLVQSILEILKQQSCKKRRLGFAGKEVVKIFHPRVIRLLCMLRSVHQKCLSVQQTICNILMNCAEDYWYKNSLRSLLSASSTPTVLRFDVGAVMTEVRKAVAMHPHDVKLCDLAHQALNFLDTLPYRPRWRRATTEQGPHIEWEQPLSFGDVALPPRARLTSYDTKTWPR